MPIVPANYIWYWLLTTENVTRCTKGQNRHEPKTVDQYFYSRSAYIWDGEFPRSKFRPVKNRAMVRKVCTVELNRMR